MQIKSIVHNIIASLKKLCPSGIRLLFLRWIRCPRRQGIIGQSYLFLKTIFTLLACRFVAKSTSLSSFQDAKIPSRLQQSLGFVFCVTDATVVVTNFAFTLLQPT
jgi:hypothetical protein